MRVTETPWVDDPRAATELRLPWLMIRRREIDAFLESLDAVPPNAVTACAGWTAHELVAHLTSGVEAIASQVDAHVDGRAVPVFGSFAEREVGFWPVDDAALRRRLADGERRMSAGLESLGALVGDGGAVAGVGWGMPIGDIALHLRQEFAVHRWDLVGDDAEGDEILGRPELIDHSVRVLADSLLARSRDPLAGKPFTARIRATGQPDLLIDLAAASPGLQLIEPDDAAVDVECDPAARLLLLWGRRPADARRVRTTLHAPDLARLTAILSGF